MTLNTRVAASRPSKARILVLGTLTWFADLRMNITTPGSTLPGLTRNPVSPRGLGRPQGDHGFEVFRIALRADCPRRHRRSPGR